MLIRPRLFPSMPAARRSSRLTKLKEETVDAASPSAHPKSHPPSKRKPDVKKQSPEAQDPTLTGQVRHATMSQFVYTLPYDRLDLRREPHLYRPGKGEQGVLMVQPYKAELLPHWRFKDPEVAHTSAEALRQRFDEYLDQDDFVGADMARKFIQMGFTRSRRYANHKGGRKYAVPASARGGRSGEQLPRSAVEDPIKAESARVFKAVLEQVQSDPRYVRLRQQFEEKYADQPIPIYHDERHPTK